MYAMNKSPIVALMLLMALAPSAPAHVPQAPLSLKARVERGLQRSDLQAFLDASNSDRAQEYEVGSAIVAAGNTNDPFWIPYLKPFLNYARNRNSEVSKLASLAQMALAKLGERAQLQEIACEANFGSSSIQYDTVTRKLKYVQGWFSIDLLAAWLEENHKFKGLLFDHGSDMVFMRPQGLALKVLPEIVPNPPPFSSEPQLDFWIWRNDNEKLSPVRHAWHEWVYQNVDSLRELTPHGEGIDASEIACKSVLAHDKHFDRSSLR